MAVKAVMSAAEYDRLPDDRNRYELLHGELLTMPPPFFSHRRLQNELVALLRAGGGRSAFVEAPIRLSPELTLVPDVCLLTSEQVFQVGPHGYLSVAPVLAVEVVSESNRAREIDRKVQAFLAHGSLEVWVIYPEERRIWVHTPNGHARLLTTHLESAALPGWRLPLDEAWAALT